jgi:hypothetical protein
LFSVRRSVTHRANNCTPASIRLHEYERLVAPHGWRRNVALRLISGRSFAASPPSAARRF